MGQQNLAFANGTDSMGRERNTHRKIECVGYPFNNNTNNDNSNIKIKNKINTKKIKDKNSGGNAINNAITITINRK
jgi:hypothetical protein